MNVGYTETKVIAEANGCTLSAHYEANHYFHRCEDGRLFNEKTGYFIRDYVMEGPSGVHRLAANVEDKQGNLWQATDKKRLAAHWATFSGSEQSFRMPNKTFTKRYYLD